MNLTLTISEAIQGVIEVLERVDNKMSVKVDAGVQRA
jgi:hypothetical protein